MVRTYYAWPTEKAFTTYSAQTPASFRFGLKATEKVTVFQYPKLKRYGKDAGTRNTSFLDPEAFRENFIGPLRPFRDRLSPIMLEFSQFYPGTLASGAEFVERLNRFFEALKDEEIAGSRWSCAMRAGSRHPTSSAWFAMAPRTCSIAGPACRRYPSSWS